MDEVKRHGAIDACLEAARKTAAKRPPFEDEPAGAVKKREPHPWARGVVMARTQKECQTLSHEKLVATVTLNDDFEGGLQIMDGAMRFIPADKTRPVITRAGKELVLVGNLHGCMSAPGGAVTSRFGGIHGATIMAAPID